jgi:hypothetical protein
MCALHRIDHEAGILSINYKYSTLKSLEVVLLE